MLAGLAGLGIWVWSNVRTSVYQDWENWAFDRQIRGERPTLSAYLEAKSGTAIQAARAWLKIPSSPKPGAPRPDTIAPPDRPPSVANNGLVGRLAIPRLHLSAMVREGVEEDTLSLALGHIPSTALPGEKGNIGVAGHRDTLFRRLRDIHVNDLIRFETVGGSHTYQVENTRVVRPQDVSVLKAGSYPELTLVTCYPFYYVGSAPDRFIVKAREVTESPAVQPSESRHVAAIHDVETHSERRARHTGRASDDPDRNSLHTVRFEVQKSHSRQLAPGISMGLTGTDVAYRRADGWMWVMPDRRTIWLRGQHAQEPVVFYRDGRMRKLVITKISANSVSGYVLAAGPGS